MTTGQRAAEDKIGWWCKGRPGTKIVYFSLSKEGLGLQDRQRWREFIQSIVRDRLIDNRREEKKIEAIYSLQYVCGLDEISSHANETYNVERVFII